MRDHGEPAEHFSSAVAIISLERIFRIEDARHDLWVYRGEYVRDRLPGAPCRLVADDLGAVYDDDLGDRDWARANFEPTRWGCCRWSCTGLPQVFFCRIQ